MDLNDCSDGGFEVVSLGLWRVEDLDGESSSRDAHQRRVVEVVLEFTGVQSGTHDHDLQIATLSERERGRRRRRSELLSGENSLDKLSLIREKVNLTVEHANESMHKFHKLCLHCIQ